MDTIDINTLKKGIEQIVMDKCGTFSHRLGYDKYGNEFAIVFGYLSGYEKTDNKYNDDGWQVCGRVAYNPYNSCMACDLELDWIMPYCEESGEVWDTTIEIYNEDDITNNLKWLIDNYHQMVLELECFKEDEDEDEEFEEYYHL